MVHSRDDKTKDRAVKAARLTWVMGNNYDVTKLANQKARLPGLRKHDVVKECRTEPALRFQELIQKYFTIHR